MPVLRTQNSGELHANADCGINNCNWLIDLLPVVRDHVYHPDFLGSFSLKYVLHPLVPGLTYDDLVIVDGLVAGVEIARLLFVAGKIPREEHDRVRQDLLNYCERDTWAMVKVLERLRELAVSTL